MPKIFMSRAGLPQETVMWVAGSGLAPMTVLILLLIPFFWSVLVEVNGGIYQ